VISGLFWQRKLEGGGGGNQFRVGGGESEMMRMCHDNVGPDGEIAFHPPPPPFVKGRMLGGGVWYGPHIVDVGHVDLGHPDLCVN
jgi:hypothetical protein